MQTDGGHKRKRKHGGGSRTKRAKTVGPVTMAPPRTGGFFGVTARRTDEKKVIDTAPASYACDTTGSVTLLDGVATGTDYTQRIGRKILLKSLYITGYVAPPGATTVGSNIARIILVYDSQTNGAAPIITDVLNSANAADQLNLNNRDRFKVLMDKRMALGEINTVATQSYSANPSVYNVKKFIRLNHDVQYSGTTNAIGS